jgi:peptidoglycan/LPS O-acetylase OafA/YrhL
MPPSVVLETEPDRAPRSTLAHLPALDGLRAIAALMVMTYHFIFNDNLFASTSLVRKFAFVGQLGVDLFFVLSGFLITRILLASKNSPNFFRIFYIRRTLRIFPLYYAFLGFTYLCEPWILNRSAIPFSEQWWYWLYLQNIPLTFHGLVANGPGHFWSLAVEEHFYLLWPLAVWLLPRRRFAWLTGGLLLVAPLIRLVFIREGFEVTYFSLTRSDALVLGSILALIASSAVPEKRVFIFRVFAAGLLVLVIALICFLKASPTWLQVLKFSMIPAAFFAVVGGVLFDRIWSPAAKILSMSLMRWAGKISYGLYVYHPLIFEISRNVLGLTAVTLFLASFGLTFALAAASYYFFERPIIELKTRFTYA